MKEEKEKIRLVTIFLGIFLILVPLDSLQIFGSISILRIFAIVPIILSFFYNKDFKINKSIAYLFLFVLYIFIQIFYTINTNATISRFTMFAMYFTLIFFCTSIKYNERETEFLNRMFAYSTIIATIAVFFWGAYEEGRLTLHINLNTREDQNQFCGYFLVGTVYFIKNILAKRKVVLSSFLIVIFLFIALLTGSRGGLLAIAISIITYIFVYSKRDKNKSKKFLLSITILIVLIVLINNVLLKLMPPEIAGRFSIKSVQESGGTGRTELWEYYLKFFEKSTVLRKFFGYGAGTIIDINRIVAHNNWIQILVENGIIGEIIFISLIISLLKKTYGNNNIYLFSVLIGYIGLTMSLSLFSYKPIWGVMLLILLRYSNNNKISKEN